MLGKGEEGGFGKGHSIFQNIGFKTRQQFNLDT